MSASDQLDIDQLKDGDKLGELLISKGLVSAKSIELAKALSGSTKQELWEVLMKLDLVTIDTLSDVVKGKSVITGNSSGVDNNKKQVTNESVVSDLSDAVEVGDTPGLVEQIFERALESRATDIHFDPTSDNKLQVRYRIDGQLHQVLQVPQNLVHSTISRIKILANMDIIEKRDAQDGHVSKSMMGKQRNFRIATVPTHHGERVVVRIMDETALFVGLDNLGLDPDQIEVATSLIHKPYGVFVVTGPVGCGKTTTLYSCLNLINQPTKNVMTVEDPVEFSFPSINQLQVDYRIEWTFPKALRAMLRQDPDIIMVGEIRDEETAKIATKAALTGVLVLTSMHSNDAAGTIGTLYNFGIPGYLISNTLLGVVAQRLVRTINQSACEEFEPDEKMREALGLDSGELPDLKLKRGTGTEEDFNTGYLGRTGVFEVMEITDILRDMIFRETTKDVIHEVAVGDGMTPLGKHGLKKVINGITTIEEVYRVALL